jgi:hypothetical protein
MPEGNPNDDNTGSIFQLKIHLENISPLIWRRIKVSGDTTIAELHYIIQLVMGWTDDHLHYFKVNGREYGVEHHGGLQFLDDPMKVCIADLKLKRNRKFSYTYNFTGRWEHEIRVEDILPPDNSFARPLCLDGSRACPPEIVYAPRIYPIFLDALSSFQMEMIQTFEKILRGKDKKLCRVEQEFIDRGDHLWEHRFFNPERFVKTEINGLLAQVYQNKGSTHEQLQRAFQEIQ